MQTSVECLAQIRDDISLCLPLHWQELALDRDRVPLDVDWARYEALDAAGILFVIALRQQHRLRGYFIGLLSGHLHYRSTMTLTQDVFWLHPDCRGGSTALRLFRAVEREARKRGVSRILAISKLHRDSSRLFLAQGYRPIETIFSKWIGDL